MQSVDRENFFESDASQAERERKSVKAANKHGSPLQMKSKILAAILDPASPSTSIFIAESAGCLRRVRLADPTGTYATYRGPKAPLTCLAIGGSEGRTIFAGSWDKDIWSWDIETTRPGRKYTGHSDFVKAVLCARISGRDILVSGGADRSIIVWDVQSGRRLHTIQDVTTTMLAVQHLAVDPLMSNPDALVLASASSDKSIRRWRITLDEFEQLAESEATTTGRERETERRTIDEHETSVYRLVFDTDSDEFDLWTASADGTVKCLARSRNFAADDVYQHGDYVRAVAVTDQWVITAGRVEDVKVWDRATGKLYCALEGHFEEVTDLVLLRNRGGKSEAVCSVSIDGTIRTWSLDKAKLDDMVAKMREPQNPDSLGSEEERDDLKLLTAEEEAALAELMED